MFSGPTGLEVIEKLIPAAHLALKPGGWLVMEISGTIAEAVRRTLEGFDSHTPNQLQWRDNEITADLQGIPRVARARKPSSSET